MGSETQVGIVLSKAQSVFRPTREHAIGLGGSAGHEVIDQDADVGLFTAQEERIFPLNFQHGVDACHESLGGRLLVSRGPVDLASKVKVANTLCLERRVQLTGRTVVVLNSIAWAEDLRLLQTWDGSDECVLDLIGEAGGDTIDVDFARMTSLGLQKNLMPWFFGKFHHLILDGGAVTGTHTVDDAGIEWRLMEIVPNDSVGLLGGVGNPAGNLFHMEHFPVVVIQRVHLILLTGQCLRNVREEWNGCIPILPLTDGEIDGLGQKSARGASLKATDLQAEFLQVITQGRNPVPHPSTCLRLESDMEESPHEGPCRDHNTLGSDLKAKITPHSHDTTVFYDQFGDVALLDGKIRKILQKGFDPELIGLLVTLGTGSTDTGSLGSIQHPELDPGGIRIQCHHTP